MANIVEYLNSFTKNKKITYYENSLPIVEEILGNGPTDFFENFTFTDLKTGLEKLFIIIKQFRE